MVNLMCRLLNLIFFGIPLLYYLSFNSSIIFCLSLGEIYLSFGISLLTSSCDFFDALVILSAIILPIKSPVAFPGSLSIFSPAVLANFFHTSIPLSINDLLYLSLKFLAKDIKPYPFTNLLSLGSIE